MKLSSLKRYVEAAGGKVGNERLFYDEMLLVADREFTHWLNRLKERE